MGYKAQAEFALILGLFVIVVIIAIYAFYSMQGPGTGPAGLSEEQKSVESLVRDAVRKAAGRTMGKIYNNGGYNGTPDSRYIEYSGSQVPYWQLCAETEFPDVEEEFSHGMVAELQILIPETTHIAGSQVVFDKEGISAETTIFEKKISLRVELPATVDGRPSQQAYEMDIESKLGRITDFAKDLSATQKDYKIFEKNLMRMVRRSNPEECELPTIGAVFKSSYSKSWQELKECMERVIEHNLARTYEWYRPWLDENDRLPEHLLRNSYIPQVKSHNSGEWVKYVDLDPVFYYGGDEEELSKTNAEYLFVTNPHPVKFKKSWIPLMPSITEYDVKYSVSFPVLIEVWDELAKRSFKFANFVNIKDNVPWDTCDLDADIGSDYEQRCKVEADSPIDLTIQNYGGEPIRGASITYDGCDIGETNGDGNIAGTSIRTSGSGELEILCDNPVTEYCENVASSDLDGIIWQIPVEKRYVVHYMVINLTTDYHIHSIQDGDHNTVDVTMSRTGNGCIEPMDILLNNYMDMDFGENEEGTEEVGFVPKKTGTADLPATESYEVRVTIAEKGETVGTATIDYQKSHIYVYAPNRVEGFDSSMVEDINDLYNNCGIDPVSHQAPQSIWLEC